jgi:hypothetical protein
MQRERYAHEARLIGGDDRLVSSEPCVNYSRLFLAGTRVAGEPLRRPLLRGVLHTLQQKIHIFSDLRRSP